MKKEELEKRILRLERLLKELLQILRTTSGVISGSREFKRFIKILEADTDFVEEQKICSNCGYITYYMEETWCRSCGTHFSDEIENEHS
ncbi:MAG: hypothetical protein GPJ52_03835 [Candidatus Heimdallarchaeota archaeon]|nr:hypothetical protein [Candidatus Heimdallarchaeota archaeon]